jgi:hypothetical protein
MRAFLNALPLTAVFSAGFKSTDIFPNFRRGGASRGCDMLLPWAGRMGDVARGEVRGPPGERKDGEVARRGSVGRGGGLGFRYLSSGFIV